MIDEREIVRKAIERLAPPEPSFERLLRRRDRKRRDQRIAAGAVGIAVFVAAIWIVTSGGPVDRSQTPAATGGVATGPTATPEPERIGFIGLPPDGATPSTPVRGELVLHFYGGTTSGPRTEMWVYADGRLIWRQENAGLPYGANPSFTGYLEQHLTPAGVELLRSEVLSTGVFEESRDLKVVNVGPCLNFIAVQRDDRLVGVSYGRDCGGEGLPLATREEADSVLRLDGRLGDVASWLPANAWEDREIRAYVPSRFAVCLWPHLPPSEPVRADRLLAVLPQEAADLLRANGLTTSTGLILDPRAGISEPTPVDSFCSTVTTEEARLLAATYDEAGYAQDPLVWALSYHFQAPGAIGRVDIGFEPIMPHGEWPCSACG